MIQWRKSSHSEGSVEGACVEVTDLADDIGIRDSKNPHGGHLRVSRSAFAALLAEVARRDV